MSTKISFGLLAISGLLLSTEATYAWVSHSDPQVRVANTTSNTQVLSGDRPSDPENVNYDTDLSERDRLDMSNNVSSSDTNGVKKPPTARRKIAVANQESIDTSARNSQALKFEANNSTYRDSTLATNSTSTLTTHQTNVFSSDVALLGSRTDINATIASSPPEFSIEIPVPPPLTQAIKKVQTVPTVPQISKIRTIPTVVAIPTVQPGTSATPTNTLPAESIQAAIYPLLTPAPVTSRFGWRTHPLTGTRRFHSGVDIGAPMGAPVVASVTGTIVSAGWNGGYGKAIVIQHGTQQTLYGHLSEISVQAGQSIDQGTVIGLVGSTGNSTGPHLHFEERISTDKGWVAVDPGAEIQYALDVLKRADPYARKDLPAGI